MFLRLILFMLSSLIQKELFGTPASAVPAAAVNSNGTFSTNDKPIFSNDRRSLWRNPFGYFLDSWVSDDFVLATKLFGKALRRFATSLSVSNNLCEKLVWSPELPNGQNHQSYKMKTYLKINYFSSFYVAGLIYYLDKFTLSHWVIFILTLYKSKVNL